MCHKATLRGTLCLFTLALAGTIPAAAQTDWRQVGGTSVELMLAAPATGPVDRVWFSPDGSVLYARTPSGKTFQTANFETWVPAADVPVPPRLTPPEPVRLPEHGATVVTTPANRTTIYALGRQLFRSDDEGRSWTNLTAFKSAAVVGTGQRGVAVPPSPADRDQLVVANDYGVWRSMDGGRSWTGLNQSLPNLPVKRILSTPTGTAGTRVQADNLGALELPPGGSVWYPVRAPEAENEAALMKWAASALGDELADARITAVGSAANSSTSAIYAGASDGRIWVSTDSGGFNLNHQRNGSRVERILVEPGHPAVALAALSGKSQRVLRTTNFGYRYYWDSLDDNLPDAAVNGITADFQGGALYAATEKGIFWAHEDLENNTSPETVKWTSLSDRLPPAAATDVRLDPAGVQLYAALDGYGVFATAAPHRLRNIQIVNAADYSLRPAAPGGMLSVIGGQVSAARGGNLDYPVLKVLGNDSQIQVPFEAVGPSVVLALQTANGLVTRDVAVQPISPAILVGPDGAPMLWDADSGLPLDLRSPAHSNGRLQIWATGLGKVQPNWPTGMPAPMDDPPVVAAAVHVYLDRSPIQVTRATLLPGYIGFYLIEVQLPAITNSGTSELFVSADGQESNRVQVVIEP
ncbi:conserved exported hypothetical protein [Candidatus Sulfopaludibacter sp. SbA4]|nr:conserved exported hypothetical protein [Candidatus Sulfopaludibacter sp. SbA4]